MKELQEYEKYKKSEVDWIGDIPSHWTFAGLNKVVSSIVDYRGKTPEKVSEGVFLVTARNIKQGRINYSLSQEFVKEEEYEEIMSRGKPKIGDVLFTTEAPLGEVANVDREDIALAQRIIKFRGKKGVLDNYYLKYWIESHGFQSNLASLATGSTATGIKASKLSLLTVLLPPIDEQKKIAEYLDQRTEEIDSLIADKEQIIRLLGEKRKAIITEAVTKGVNSKVEMKSSGIDWIGEIPEHWSVYRLKYLFDIVKRIDRHPDPTVLSVTQQGIKVKDISTNEGQLADNYDNYQTVDVEDFVMNHMDLLTGFIDVSKYNGVTSPDYRVFKIRNQKFNKYYFLYYFQMCYYRKIFYRFGQGVSKFGRWRLPADEFRNFFVPVPPVEEQNDIVKYLSTKLKNLFQLKIEIDNVIEKLKEYRQSIIYEAVTGKIDVSNYPLERKEETHVN